VKDNEVFLYPISWINYWAIASDRR